MKTSSQFCFLSLIAIWFISITAFGATTIHPDESMTYDIYLYIAQNNKEISLIFLFQFSFYLRFHVSLNIMYSFLIISIEILYIYLMTYAFVCSLEDFLVLS